MCRAVLWWNWSAASAALASVWEEGKSTTWVCSSCDWPRTGLLLKTAGYTWVLTLNSRLHFKLNWWVLIGGICAQLQILNDLSGALTDKCLQVSAVRRHRCNQSSRNVDITGEVQTSVSIITLNMIDLWINCPEVASPIEGGLINLFLLLWSHWWWLVINKKIFIRGCHLFVLIKSFSLSVAVGHARQIKPSRLLPLFVTLIHIWGINRAII